MSATTLTPADAPPAGTAPSEQEWATAVGALHAAGEVVLACHSSPDGDALGSLLALAEALRRLGKRTVASWGSDPFVVPAAYRTLPLLDLVQPPHAVPPAPDLLVTLDAGSLDRLGLLMPVVEAAAEVLVIDHHASNTGFGSLHLVDPRAPATVVLVDELIRRLGVPLTADMAAPLYAGLVSDTGSFRYAATTAATHEFAARLLATGIRHDVISRRIWDTNSFGYVRLLGDVLSRVVLEPDAAGGLGMVWTYSTAADLTTHGVDFEQVEGVIDVLRTAEEAEVAVVCKTDLDGSLKVSTRSKGRIDVGEVCVAMGGGGHRFAAGFTSCSSDVPATMAEVRALLAAAPHLPA